MGNLKFKKLTVGVARLQNVSAEYTKHFNAWIGIICMGGVTSSGRSSRMCSGREELNPGGAKKEFSSQGGRVRVRVNYFIKQWMNHSPYKFSRQPSVAGGKEQDIRPYNICVCVCVSVTFGEHECSLWLLKGNNRDKNAKETKLSVESTELQKVFF